MTIIISISKDKKEVTIRKNNVRIKRLKTKKYGKYTIPLAKMIEKNNINYKNYFETNGDTTTIIVYNNNIYYSIIIDTEDISKIIPYRWYIRKAHYTNYAKTTINEKEVSIQALIMDCFLRNYTIDHIDRNGLNNKKNNLRKTSISINGKNRTISKNNKTKFPGISYSSYDNSYRASWYDYKGNQKSKNFSIKKYGKRKAFTKALSIRFEKGIKFGYIFSKADMKILKKYKVVTKKILIIKNTQNKI